MTSKQPSALFKNSVPYSPALGLAFGTAPALLIQQIHYWCIKRENSQDGFYWVYKTYRDWANELPGFDPKTVQRALETLRTLGIVVVSNYNKFRYDRTLWYRLDYECLQRQLETHLPNWTICLNPSGQFVLTPLDKKSTPIPETTQKTTEETPCVDSATPGKPKALKIPAGKEPFNLIEEPPMAKTPTSTATILNNIKIANGSALPSGNNSKSAQALWQRLVPREHQSVGMMPELTIVKRGQLSHIVKALGSRSDATITYVIKNWIGYCKFVEAQAGLKKSPDVPDIGFLLKHIGPAASYTASQLQLIAKPKPKVKVDVKCIEAPPELTAQEKDFLKEDENPAYEKEDEIASADFILNWKPED